MEDTYFVIHNSDGDTTVEAVNKEELLERIEENYYGEVLPFDRLPQNNDTNYWGNRILIIKGKIVSPVAKQIITKYNIE